MGIGDHQLDAAQPALHQAVDKARPERLHFRRTNAEADDLAPASSSGAFRPTRAHRRISTMTKDANDLAEVQRDIAARLAKWQAMYPRQNLYSHVTETMQEDAAAKIDAVFRSAITGVAGTC